MAESVEGVVWFEAHTRVTMVEVAQSSGLPEDLLRELVEYGALSTGEGGTMSAAIVGRLREAKKLREDLELDVEALALVVRYLERIEALQGEVRRLRALVGPPSSRG